MVSLIINWNIKLHESCKEIKEEQAAKKRVNFEINVLNRGKEILDNFQSVNSNNPKVSKTFRLSKNGKGIGFLRKISDVNKKNFPRI